MQCQQASELNLKNNHTYERGHEYVRTETDSSSFFIPRKRCVAEFIYEKKDVKHLDTVKQDVKQLWEDDSDDFCEICGEGGQLMLCDSCPSAFHPSCLNFEAVPDGDWHCSRCQCHRCGRGPQLNSFETKMISCSQCLSMYHRCCVTDQNFANMVTDPWFCSSICRSVFKRLQGLVGRMFSLENGIQWMLLGSLETKHGRDNERMKDVRKCLSRAYKLLDQCFDPIVDQKSGVDLLSQMIFSGESHLKRLDCRGFYTIVLMEGEQLISAATVRIHGNSVAEMPLIGTNIQFRNQGMCKLLMKALQGMLKNIGVHELVLPSIPHLVESWVGSFGFKLISSDVWEERILSANLLPFPGTTLLHKTLRHS
ncbi:hypothetical protein KP509_07G009300 [Ceratopteris richardii]|nr:hypothetical protein KP509_07G009300 [Ceratopteris richardii]